MITGPTPTLRLVARALAALGAEKRRERIQEIAQMRRRRAQRFAFASWKRKSHRKYTRRIS